MARLLLGDFSHIDVENQEKKKLQMASQYEFGKKANSSQAVDYKDTAEEISIAEKIKNTKYGLCESQQAVELHLLQPQNYKTERLCFIRKPQSNIYQNGNSHIMFENGNGIENLFLRMEFRGLSNPLSWPLNQERRKPGYHRCWQQTLASST